MVVFLILYNISLCYSSHQISCQAIWYIFSHPYQCKLLYLYNNTTSKNHHMLKLHSPFYVLFQYN